MTLGGAAETPPPGGTASAADKQDLMFAAGEQATPTSAGLIPHPGNGTQAIACELLDAETEKVDGSRFDLAWIVVGVRLVLEATISMRAASRVGGIINQLAGRPPYEQPCHVTIQNFILRIGLFLLQRDDLRHDDWIWIADHTFSVGTTKCFAVLGIRHSDYVQLRRPLEHRDLEVLLLEPVEQSNGPVVCRQMKELTGRCGVPLAVLSDRGSDLNKGVQLLRQDHPEVLSLYDIKHMVSRMIEKLLVADEHWDAFRKACCTCANAVRQSGLAHLKPPRPKTKSRYMNIDREVRWGARALQVLDRVRGGELTERQQQRLPREQIEEKLGWLDEYREALGSWESLSLTGQRALEVVRREGYGTSTTPALEKALGAPPSGPSRLLVEQIKAEVRVLSEASSVHGKLPSSSEVLESLFSKGKRLLSGTSQGTSNSLTGQLLAMVSATARITPELVRRALSTCRIKHVRKWCAQKFGIGVHRARREDLGPTSEEQKSRKQKTPAIPVF